MALNRTLSSPLPVKAGVTQGSVLGPVLFLIFINDLFDSLKYPPYPFADDSTFCHDIPHPRDRQATASSLSSDLEKTKSQADQTLGTSLSILTNLTLSPPSLSLSLQKDCLSNHCIYFLNNPLEEVQSFKLLGFTISHDLSWANHISKSVCKASRQLGILLRTSPFLAHLDTVSLCAPKPGHSPGARFSRPLLPPVFGDLPARRM